MFELNVLWMSFVTFAFISQALLIFNFAALKWMPHIQQKWGWRAYSAGLFALLLGILFWVGGPTWYFGLVYALFTIWAAFGYIIEILLPIDWREPIRWQIFIP